MIPAIALTLAIGAIVFLALNWENWTFPRLLQFAEWFPWEPNAWVIQGLIFFLAVLTGMLLILGPGCVTPTKFRDGPPKIGETYICVVTPDGKNFQCLTEGTDATVIIKPR